MDLFDDMLFENQDVMFNTQASLMSFATFSDPIFGSVSMATDGLDTLPSTSTDNFTAMDSLVSASVDMDFHVSDFVGTSDADFPGARPRALSEPAEAMTRGLAESRSLCRRSSDSDLANSMATMLVTDLVFDDSEIQSIVETAEEDYDPSLHTNPPEESTADTKIEEKREMYRSRSNSLRKTRRCRVRKTSSSSLKSPRQAKGKSKDKAIETSSSASSDYPPRGRELTEAEIADFSILLSRTVKLSDFDDDTNLQLPKKGKRPSLKAARERAAAEFCGFALDDNGDFIYEEEKKLISNIIERARREDLNFLYNKLKEVAFAGDYDDRDRRDTSKMGILDRAREVILTLQDEEQQLVHAKEQVQLENEHYCRKLASIAFQ